MSARTIALPAALLVALLLAGPVAAAEPVFPPGSHIGLVPPPGMVTSKVFEGFEDRDKSVVIVIVELASSAYSEIEKGFSAEAMKAQGTEVDARNDVALKEGHGFILAAHQEAAGSKIRKWILVATAGQLTTLVSAQVPETAKDAYPDDVVRSALKSVAVRAVVPVQEELDLLPFALKELAGFRIVRAAANGAALLTDGPSDAIELTEQPVFLITTSPSGPDQPGDRDSLARRAIASTPGVKDVHIERSESLRIGGLPGHEMILQAKDPKNGTALMLVQWMRFGAGGYMRMLGVTRKDDWDKMFPRFRAVRDGIEPK